MDKLEELIKKVCTREVILYIIFGVLTTLVNIVVSYIGNEFLHIEGNIASTIGIIASILFAYVTNRKMVFNSKVKGFQARLLEFGKFILGRAFTMVIEMLGFYLLYTICAMPMLVGKCIITVIVIVLNFFISKFFTFKQK